MRILGLGLFMWGVAIVVTGVTERECDSSSHRHSLLVSRHSYIENLASRSCLWCSHTCSHCNFPVNRI